MKKNLIIMLVTGWALSRFGFSMFRDMEWLGFIMEPGVLAVTLLAFLVLFENGKPTNVTGKMSLIATGVVVDSLIYWLVRPGNDILNPVNGPWDNVVWLSSIVSLGLVILFILFFSKLPASQDSEIKNKKIGLVISTCLSTVVFFRLIYLLTAHLPNEERSTFIYGVEIHHIAYGAIILIGMFASCRWKSIYESSLLCALLGIAVGMILDQSIYVMLPQVSDTSYNSTQSWVGAITLLTIFSFTAKWISKSKYA